MDLFEALKRRRAHRNYLPDPVSADSIEQILYAFSRAPTASNRPYRHAILIDDPQVIRSVKQVAPALLANAPLLLVIFTDVDVATDRTGPVGERSSLIDSGAAGENVLLAATALGLGSQFTMISFQAGIRIVLGLPENCRVDLIMPLGFPATTPSPTATAPRSANIVHHNQFGVIYGRA